MSGDANVATAAKDVAVLNGQPHRTIPTGRKSNQCMCLPLRANRVIRHQERDDFLENMVLEAASEAVDIERIFGVEPIPSTVGAVGTGDDGRRKPTAYDQVVEFFEELRADKEMLVYIRHVEKQDQ